MGITIGLPRAMLYHEYGILWKEFFKYLNIETITSQETTREIIKNGIEAASSETCFSTKIFMGHVNALIGKCDYILVPRVSNFGWQQVMCTKFLALYDQCVNTFCKTNQKFISYNVDVVNKISEEKAFMALGQELGKSKKEAVNAYRQAKKAEQLYIKNRCAEQKKMLQSDKIKIIIAAHSYIIEDSYIGKPIIKYLNKLGIEAVRADITNYKDSMKTSLKVCKTLNWELSRKIIGGLELNKDNVAGIVLVSAFPCGPDSMVNEMILHKFKGTPILNLILDSQTGIAGLETRLESFVDIIMMRRKQDGKK